MKGVRRDVSIDLNDCFLMMKFLRNVFCLIGNLK